MIKKYDNDIIFIITISLMFFLSFGFIISEIFRIEDDLEKIEYTIDGMNNIIMNFINEREK